MSLPTKPTMAVVADEVVEMLNDKDRAWFGEFVAVRKYGGWEPSPDSLAELRVVVTYGDSLWAREYRASMRKVHLINITFRKNLEEPEGEEPDVAIQAEMDALAALVETVADWFAADTTKGGPRMVVDGWVAGIEFDPTYSPEKFAARQFASRLTLMVDGIRGVLNPDNE